MKLPEHHEAENPAPNLSTHPVLESVTLWISPTKYLSRIESEAQSQLFDYPVAFGNISVDVAASGMSEGQTLLADKLDAFYLYRVK